MITEFQRIAWENNFNLDKVYLTCNEPYTGIAAASYEYKPLPKKFISDYGVTKVFEKPPKIKKVINPIEN